jgi:hypothetical protein
MTDGRSAALARRALGLAALALASLALLCGVAAANEYHVFACQDPYTGQSAPAAGWGYDQGTNGYGDGASSSCAEGGGSISAWLDGGVTHGFGEGAYATFNAPGQMTISAFKLWRYEAAGPYEPYAAPADNIAYNPGNVSLEGLCAQPLGCASRGTNQQRLAAENEVGASNLVGVTQIQASAVCGGGPGTSYVCPQSNAENGNSAEVDIYAADIMLNDPTVPTVTDLGGPLVSGATLTGAASVSFLASDGGGPGVYSGTITVDGEPQVEQILDSNGGACQSLSATEDGLRSFNYPQPCKSQVSATMTLDTGALPAGTHNVVLSVDDASGNSTVAWDGTITTAHPDLPNGNPACEKATIVDHPRWAWNPKADPLRRAAEGERHADVRQGAGRRREHRDQRRRPRHDRHHERLRRVRVPGSARRRPNDQLQLPGVLQRPRPRGQRARANRGAAAHPPADHPTPDAQRRHDRLARKDLRRPLPLRGRRTAGRSPRRPPLAAVRRSRRAQGTVRLPLHVPAHHRADHLPLPGRPARQRLIRLRLPAGRQQRDQRARLLTRARAPAPRRSRSPIHRTARRARSTGAVLVASGADGHHATPAGGRRSPGSGPMATP